MAGAARHAAPLSGGVAGVGEDVLLAGQQTKRALRALRAEGVTTVVNLSTPEEITRDAQFDEPRRCDNSV